MKIQNFGVFLFFLIPIFATGLDTGTGIYDEDIARAIPPGFDANAVEITYSTFINGDLSVAGTINPAPGVGTAKNRSYFFPATTLCNRMTTSPDTKFTDTYGPNNRPIPTYQMLPSGSTQRYLSVLFPVPTTFDTGVNPTVDLYIAVSIQGQPAGRTARFNIDVDYAASGDTIGSTAPATGLDQNISTLDLVITEPTGLSNLKIYKISGTLSAGLVIPGSLCGLYFWRGAPVAGTEYAVNLYLVAVGFNFSVT